jgi:hypothetical protein
VVGQGAIRLGALSLRDFQLVSEADGGDAKEFVVAFDAAFDVGFQIICCGDSARFQRAGKCAGQSTSERGDDVVDGGGKRRGVFHAVIFGVPAVHAKMKWLRKSFNVRFTERPFLLDQTDFCGMNKFTHGFLPGDQILEKTKSYRRDCGLLFVVLNQRKDVEALQFAAAFEEREFDGEGGAFDGAAELLDELGGGSGGAAGG